MEGVVRAPSEFSITLGLPPSMIATQELVVPRSIPMIFPMAFPFEFSANNLATDMGINPLSSSLGVLGPRDGDERRPNHPVVQRVAFLQHVDHRVRLLLRWEHADGLMSVRVELFPDRVDLLEIGLLEYRAQLLQGQLDPALQSLKGGGIRGKRRFQTVLDGKQLPGVGGSFGLGFPTWAVRGLRRRRGRIDRVIAFGSRLGGWVRVRHRFSAR